MSETIYKIKPQESFFVAIFDPISSTITATAAAFGLADALDDDGPSQTKEEKLQNLISGAVGGAEQFKEQLAVEPVDLDKVFQFSKDLIAENIRRIPEITATSLREATGAAAELDEFQSQRFFKNLENIFPDFEEAIIGTSRDLLERTTAITQSFLSGEIPEDVRDEITRTRAELGISQGLFGEAASFATARDLGLTSLDLVSRGAQFATEVVSPLTQRLLSSAQQLTPPVSDVTSIFGQIQGIGAGASIIQPTAALNTGANVAVANANAAFNTNVSALNASFDALSTVFQSEANKDAIQAAQTNTLISAGAQIAGATIGAVPFLG